MQAQIQEQRREAEARAQSQKSDLLRTEDKLSEQVRAIREAQYTNATNLQSGVDQLSAKLRNLEEKTLAIDKKVEEFKTPLEKVTSWQARAAGALAFATIAGGVMWWVIQQLLVAWFKKGG